MDFCCGKIFRVSGAGMRIRMDGRKMNANKQNELKGTSRNPGAEYERILEFDKIKELLEQCAVTDFARKEIANLRPELSQLTLLRLLRETSEACTIMRSAGNPPLQDVEEAKQALDIVNKDGLLSPEQLERIQVFAAAGRRLRSYLKKAQETQAGLAFYGDNIEELEELYMEINRCIRGREVDDNATGELSDIRRQLEQTQQQIRRKVEETLKTKKQYCNESFVAMKDGHYTIPVKKEYKFQVPGSVIAVSATGTTCFIEPTAVTKLTEKLQLLKTREEMEEEKILYTLTAMVHANGGAIENNMGIMEKLDFIFAKGKLSMQMEAVPPEITLDRKMEINQGRHPLLGRDICVPIDFSIGGDYRGIIITGPNTGGKTVALKLVGLFALMAQCGLHLPCRRAVICMNSNVVCDIGDGQNIAENLSTFSAHITNIVQLLEKTGPQTLVLLDELGSGTDPGEGMGIAIAILEELRNRKCLFVATTHYAEVKEYGEVAEGLINARMTFDKETLQPLYKLVLGEAGESCAFHVARRLGFPEHLLEYAHEQTYGGKRGRDYAAGPAREFQPMETMKTMGTMGRTTGIPGVQAIPQPKKQSEHAGAFRMGDSVMVYPEKKVGIIYRPADEKGYLVVQIQGKKKSINHTRLKLKASAAELYPPDYDFSIIFDTVANRKAKHRMDRKYSPDTQAVYPPG